MTIFKVNHIKYLQANFEKEKFEVMYAPLLEMEYFKYWLLHERAISVCESDLKIKFGEYDCISAT